MRQRLQAKHDGARPGVFHCIFRKSSGLSDRKWKGYKNNGRRKLPGYGDALLFPIQLPFFLQQLGFDAIAFQG